MFFFEFIFLSCLFNFFYMDKSRFFVSAVSYPETTMIPTVMLVPEQQADGSTVVSPRSVESYIDPLSALTFDDFALNKLIENGVSYKSLNINPDLRLGFESEVDAFNSRLEEMSEQLFTSKN